VDAVGLFYANHGVGMLGAYTQVEWDDGFLPVVVRLRFPSMHEQKQRGPVRHNLDLFGLKDRKEKASFKAAHVNVHWAGA
jgi:hypothetical protein